MAEVTNQSASNGERSGEEPTGADSVQVSKIDYVTKSEGGEAKAVEAVTPVGDAGVDERAELDSSDTKNGLDMQNNPAVKQEVEKPEDRKEDEVTARVAAVDVEVGELQDRKEGEVMAQVAAVQEEAGKREDCKDEAMAQVADAQSGDASPEVSGRQVKDAPVGEQVQESSGAKAMEIDAYVPNASNQPGAEKATVEGDESVKPEASRTEEELQAGVVVNPKKRGGRQKRRKEEPVLVIEPTGTEPMETSDKPKDENSKEENDSTKKRQKQRREIPFFERDRPARERKSIERFVASEEKEKQAVVIKQGSGTPSWTFLTANSVKYNLYRFSGFVWGENEEKEKNRVKEKLERYTKEGLGQLIDLLDLHLPKTGKKEELVVKVLQFLESPYKTTDVSIGEREQMLKERKRKRRGSGKGRGGFAAGRKRRKEEDSSPKKRRARKKKDESDTGGGDDADASSGEDDLEVEEVAGRRLTFKSSEEDDDDDEEDEDYEAKAKPRKKKSSKSDVKEVRSSRDEEIAEGDGTSKKTSEQDFSLEITAVSDVSKSASKPPDKVYTKGARKKSKETKEKEVPEKDNVSKKDKEGNGRKRRGKGKAKEGNIDSTSGRGGKAKKVVKRKRNIPSDKELRKAICVLLDDLTPPDFNKVTYMDIVIRLENRFDVDLEPNKAKVKQLIREELTRFSMNEEVAAPVEGREAQEGDAAVAEPPPAFSDVEKDAVSDEPDAKPAGEVAAEDSSGVKVGGDVSMSEVVEDVKDEQSPLQPSSFEEPSDAVAGATD